jgi:sugar phosphate isomerase/epimerase
MKLGINLCFAVKRFTEPEMWAEFVRSDLDLDTVQFTFDLLDPWWPETGRGKLIRRARSAAEAWGLTIQSAYAGLAHYVQAGLLDPDPEGRAIALEWWRRSCDVAGELGASAVGGPLGTLSVREAADRTARSRRYEGLLDSVEAITAHAAAAGLREFLIEPTPLAREIPSTIPQCSQLLNDLRGRCTIPAGLTLDIGHTLFEPLYGPDASAQEWISAIGPGIRMLHLDNTDGHGDPHWGWPHDGGRVDLVPVAASLTAADLADVTGVLEVYPRFEDDDDQVRQILIDSVAYCRLHLEATLQAAAEEGQI